jgi:hypothetical protein
MEGQDGRANRPGAAGQTRGKGAASYDLFISQPLCAESLPAAEHVAHLVLARAKDKGCFVTPEGRLAKLAVAVSDQNRHPGTLRPDRQGGPIFRLFSYLHAAKGSRSAMRLVQLRA